MNLTHQRIVRSALAVVIASLSLAGSALAQHYPAGAEGIRTATLPPPGIYFRDYNFVYWSDRFPDGPPGFEAFAYVNAPRLIWMTDWKIFGADYGMDIIVPFGYARVKADVPESVRHSRFGLGDIQIEPVLLAWHPQQFDIALAYAVWAPTGDFNPQRLANLGTGFWGHMFTAGATWYPDQEKTWALGVLNRYEINHEQDKTGITPGHMLTTEWGLSRTVHQGIDIGLIGYWQQQVTRNTGPGTSGELSHVVGIGPEILAFCPKLGLFTSLRYVRELDAKNRPEGNTVTLTLTKRF
jgi:hypothetical protein